MFERQSTEVTDKLIRETRDTLLRDGILISHKYEPMTKTYIIRSYDYMDEYKHKTLTLTMLQLKQYAVGNVIIKLVQNKIIPDPKNMSTLKHFEGFSLYHVIDGLASLNVHNIGTSDRGDFLHFMYKGTTLINISKLVLHNYNYKVIIRWLEDTDIIEKYTPYYIDTSDIRLNNYSSGTLTIGGSITGDFNTSTIITSGSCIITSTPSKSSKTGDVYNDLVNNFNSWIKG